MSFGLFNKDQQPMQDSFMSQPQLQKDMMMQAVQDKQLMEQMAPLEKEDPGKWELDTDPWLNRVYHELLGESLNLSTGLWETDKKKTRVMNELGASQFITEVSSRASIHMQMSDLTDIDIIEIASRAAEIYADKIEDNWVEWKIVPSRSNFESIAQKMYDILFITLRIARNGGMKKHRERAKNPYANISPRQEGGIV